MHQRLIKTIKPSVAVLCLIAFHAAAAKSDSAAPDQPAKALPSQPLILTLPNQIPLDSPNQWQTRAASNPEEQQLIAEGRKSKSVDLNCGMNMVQNAAPEVSLTGRVGGECDVKYHY